MRHRKRSHLKLGRKSAHRKALLANLASSLILNEYIETTVAKAKACKSYVDKVIYAGRDKSLHARRKVDKFLRNRLATDKVINVLADRFKDRTGGYTSLVRTRVRAGDGAEMAKLILIGSDAFKKAKKVRVSKGKGKKAVKKPKAKKATKAQKKGVFGGIRGRIFGKGQKGKAGQTDKEQRQIQAKTRSGI